MSTVSSLQARPNEVPADYPRQFERRLRLHDGREVFIRPLIPADRDPLREAILSADRPTLRHRFLGSPPPLTDEVLTHLTTLDYRTRFALVAADPATGHGIAVARFDTVSDTIAEVAVAVDPAWRRAGLATILVELLAQAAIDRGIATFTAMYFAENLPVANLVRHADDEGRCLIRESLAEASISLDRAQIARALRDLADV